jgi:TRAP-type C4-dicarboxylate transport system permease small subunit
MGAVPTRSAPPEGEEGRTRPSATVMTRIASLLEWSGKIIAAACLVFMFGALLVNVVLRYLFGSGIPWAYEIHAVLLPWLVAGGVVIASARGRNISITILPDMLRGGSRTALMVAIDVAIIVIAISVLWSSQPIIRAAQFQTLPALGVTQVWGYASLVYAFGLVAVLAALDGLSLVLTGAGLAEDDPALKSLS